MQTPDLHHRSCSVGRNECRPVERNLFHHGNPPAFSKGIDRMESSSSTKQLWSQTPLRNTIRQRSAQDVHWWIGFEIERLNFQSSPLLAFGDTSPTPSAVGNRCSFINCIASSGRPIRSTGRTPVVSPVVICCVQNFASSWHY